MSASHIPYASPILNVFSLTCGMLEELRRGLADEASLSASRVSARNMLLVTFVSVPFAQKTADGILTAESFGFFFVTVMLEQNLKILARSLAEANPLLQHYNMLAGFVAITPGSHKLPKDYLLVLTSPHLSPGHLLWAAKGA